MFSWFQKNKATYDVIAEHFAETRKGYSSDLQSLIQYAKKGNRVLDIGCGSGRVYHLLKNFQVNYTGMDVSEGQLTVARRAYPKANFVEGDMRDLPFPDVSFDIVYCIAAFHHLEHASDRKNALQEMYRVLTTEGMLVMTNWDLLGPWAQKKVEAGVYHKIGERDYQIPWKDFKGTIVGERYYHAFAPQELESLFKEAGFEMQKQYQTDSESQRPGNIISILEKRSAMI